MASSTALLEALPLAAAAVKRRREFSVEPAAPLVHDDIDLATRVRDLTGVIIPDRAVCPGHTAPLKALAEAYFARSPVTVWHASRGFGGKSTLLALLGYLEAVLLGAEATILGGSGQQSQRVHDAQQSFWFRGEAPRYLLLTDPTRYETRLSNGGRVQALMASQRSARGPHPSRLRLDECDEIALPVFDAALGQTMSKNGLAAQTVMSSTHQYADGTMTEILRRAAERGWPVQRWCYRESLKPNGWLDPSEVERKRLEVPAAMWEAEYELQEPEPGARAILQLAIEAAFDPAIGQFAGAPGETIVIEPPVEGAKYATGADWAKDRDWTIVPTLRTDVRPWRLVAYRRDGRRPWPLMVDVFNERVRRYPGAAAHDATGLGDVVDDLLTVQAEGVQLVGRARADLLSEYISSTERSEWRGPRIEHPYSEHRYATNNDLYGSGHLPDTICGLALAVYAARHNRQPNARLVGGEDLDEERWQ